MKKSIFKITLQVLFSSSSMMLLLMMISIVVVVDVNAHRHQQQHFPRQQLQRIITGSSSSSSSHIISPIIPFTSKLMNNEAQSIFQQNKKNKMLSTTSSKTSALSSSSSLLLLETIPRGGGDSSTDSTSLSIINIVGNAIKELKNDIIGIKSDFLILLLTIGIIPSLCNKIGGLSSILGFLFNGLLLGPKGPFNVINNIHLIEIIGDIGIVLFLFEMGIHLNIKTLISMKNDVFGVGGLQFILTSIIFIIICNNKYIFNLSLKNSIIISGSLALSSSAFVLQLLKDKNKLNGTQFGKSSFGILLLQDLAVVPLLILTQLLGSGSGSGSDGNNGNGNVKEAIISALIKATMAISSILLIGKYALNPIFNFVIGSSNSKDDNNNIVIKNEESFIGIILFFIIGFSLLTEGLGLSNTLGAFMAGVLMASNLSNNMKHNIEKTMSSYRGILVSIFFFTVGFELDIQLIYKKFPLVMTITLGIMTIKTIITTFICNVIYKLNLQLSQHIGLLLCQGGEFAFVIFKLARSLNILDNDITNLLLTCVSLTMSLTPIAYEIGNKLQEQKQKSS